MNIRKAKKEDLDRLVSLNEKLVSEHIEIDNYYSVIEDMNSLWKLDIENHLQDPKSCLLVAEENGKIIGYIMGSLKERYKIFAIKHYAEIWSSYIEKKFRQKGVMKELFTHFKGWVKESGADIIELHVDSRNKDAYKAWKFLGFEQLKTQMELHL